MNTEKTFTEIVARKVTEEFHLGFIDDAKIERGIIIKVRSDGKLIIPSGKTKLVFDFSELEKIELEAKGHLVTLPFIVGNTDFAALDSMKPETFSFFMKELRQALGISKSQKEPVK